MREAGYLIDCESLQRSLGDDAICIVDCRFDLANPTAGFTSYCNGHIPGAVFADLDKDLAAPIGAGTGRHPLPEPEVFAATLRSLGVSADSQVICYDQDTGALAARLWWMLRWLGHENARILDGGITHWRALDLPVETGSVTRPMGDFRGSARPELVLDTAEIVERGAAALHLVDARDSERFAGRLEPIDPVAGHVPGAINAPVAASLRPDGTWKDDKALNRLWEGVLGDAYGAPWSVMCGSGVTACHLVISGLKAGLPEPRVYVGSWSEWIADPARPVATERDEEG